MVKNKKYLILITLISCIATAAWTPLLPKDVATMQAEIVKSHGKVVEAYNKFLATDNPLAKALMPTLKIGENLVERAKDEQDPNILKLIKNQIDLQGTLLKEQEKIAKEFVAPKRPGDKEAKEAVTLARQVRKYQEAETKRTTEQEKKELENAVKIAEAKIAKKLGFTEIDKKIEEVESKIKGAEKAKIKAKLLATKTKARKLLENQKKILAEARGNLEDTKETQQKNLVDLSEKAKLLDTEIKDFAKKEATETDEILRRSLTEQLKAKNVELETTKKTIKNISEEIKTYGKLLARLTETEGILQEELGKREFETVDAESKIKSAESAVKTAEKDPGFLKGLLRPKRIKNLKEHEKKLIKAKVDIEITKKEQQKNLDALSAKKQKLDTDISTMQSNIEKEKDEAKKVELKDLLFTKKTDLTALQKEIKRMTVQVAGYDKTVTEIEKARETVTKALRERVPLEEVKDAEKLVKGAQDLITGIEKARRDAQVVEERSRIIRENEIPDIIIALMTEDPLERKALLEQLRAGSIQKRFVESYRDFVLFMKTPSWLVIGQDVKASVKTKKLKKNFLKILNGNEKDLEDSRKNLHNIEKKLAILEAELNAKLKGIKEAAPKARVDAMIKKLNTEVKDSEKVRELVQKETKETVKLIQETKKAVVLGDAAIHVLKRLIYKKVTRDRVRRAIAGVASANRFKKELQNISHIMKRSLPEPGKRQEIITRLYVSLMEQLPLIQPAPAGNRAKVNIASYLGTLERDFRDEVTKVKRTLYGKTGVAPSLRRLETALGLPAPPPPEEPVVPAVERQIKQLIELALTTQIASVRAIAENIMGDVQNRAAIHLNQLNQLLARDQARLQPAFGPREPRPEDLPPNLIANQNDIRTRINRTVNAVGAVQPPLQTNVINHLRAQITELNNLRRHPAGDPQRPPIIQNIRNNQNNLVNDLNNFLGIIRGIQTAQERILNDFNTWKAANMARFDAAANQAEAERRSTTIIGEMRVVIALIESYANTIRNIQANQGTVQAFTQVLE